MKEFLYQMRLELCKGRKSRKWNIEDLEKVFKCLKNNKARDAHGHTYELYKNGGSDLKSSLLKLVNLVKEKQIYPKIFQLANITSLYKKRGEKSDFNSERGIFNTVKIRSILDRLVYNEKYSEIDESMSGSNIGARKERNIRDHLFVINAILHEASENKKNLDVEIYDIEKCFDKLWASETANDMFNAGLNDDKFVLVANSNSECQVAVKTPWGTLTERKTMENIEMQGGVLTPLKCSVTIDTLGKETLASTECGKTLYKYRDCVKIPALSFVDDILSVTECGPNSVKMNAYVQSKVDSKKLRLSDKKCVKMHIGGNKNSCPSLKIHETEMKISQKEKYLGDVITNDTKQDENIKMRYDKGIGISNGILSTLKEVSFGIYYFQMGMMFRTSLLLNGILFNTEAMFSVTDKHISTLEETDRYLLRQILGTGTETPIESLYIETASLPVKYIWKGRRIMYYWTMLHKGEDEIAKQVFSAMKEFPSKKSDWMTQVNEDLRYFDIEETEEEITKMKRDKFKDKWIRKSG